MIRVHLGNWKVARAAALVVALLSTSAIPASGIAATLPAGHVAACERLQGFIVPASEIGLPTSGAAVTAVKPVAASGSGASALPEYCEVTG
ncbi:MAG: tannase/feruloyl esterase family alpha/beta hydrolase, partial [Paraburkholderia graminis]